MICKLRSYLALTRLSCWHEVSTAPHVASALLKYQLFSPRHRLLISATLKILGWTEISSTLDTFKNKEATWWCVDLCTLPFHRSLIPVTLCMVVVTDSSCRIDVQKWWSRREYILKGPAIFRHSGAFKIDRVPYSLVQRDCPESQNNCCAATDEVSTELNNNYR